MQSPTRTCSWRPLSRSVVPSPRALSSATACGTCWRRSALTRWASASCQEGMGGRSWRLPARIAATKIRPTFSRILMSSASVHTETDRRWNHNLQFHGWILRQMPHACESALDVGCGDGVLTTKLASRSIHVTGIDISPEMIATARREAAQGNITYVTGDVLSSPLPADGFDFVAVVAAIHHMPLDAALARFARL